MSELRAPDPTLSSSQLGLVFIEWMRDEPHYVAHRGDTSPDRIDLDLTVCGKPNRRLRAFEPAGASYIATTCKACFPDAPPPGYHHCPMPGYTDEHHDAELCRGTRDMYLAWQVQP